MKRIIYKNETNDGICVLIPFDIFSSIEEIAKRDVPTGMPYKIIDESELPSDKTFREAWDIDLSNPDGYGE